jgi:excinuclease UvrABC ATPase subunit
MSSNSISIKNAHVNNLKNVNLDIPKHRLVVFTGVSGSGKSSLLFDTIFTEAQRQLIETFSTFARTRMPKLSRPDVDEILNLSTAIVIDQKRMGKNLRSTVGTATEINTYLRLLYSRLGKPFIGPSFLFSFNHPDGMCPLCHGLGKTIQVDLDLFLDMDKSLYDGAVLYPGMQPGSWFWREINAIQLFNPHKKLKDYTDKELEKLLYSEPVPIDKKHAAGTYSKNFEGIARKLERSITAKAEDEAPDEKKDAYKKFIVYTECKGCGGTRLNEKARSVKISGLSIAELCSLEQQEVLDFISPLDDEISKPIIRKARFLVKQMIEIGAGYLSLDRSVATLSGGESQRVKMAKQLDCNLVDLLYVLDEPSIGLHPRDTEKLMSILFRLKERGNSVCVVEHDPEIIRAADWIVDMGPKAGNLGGEVIYNGPAENLETSGGLTARWLSKRETPSFKRKTGKEFFLIDNAQIFNLKNISVKIPQKVLTCITGVAGSGKSTLIHECFVKTYPGAIIIDQSPIGKSSRANIATYIGAFDFIRKVFADATGANKSLFSFNSKGACLKCNGRGSLSFELFFLDAVKTVCDGCNGKRYKDEVLNLTYKKMNIADVLEMSVDQAHEFFTDKKINKLLAVLKDVGLGYLEIGQSLSTLSGGECQRLKIASELHKDGNIYVMDEPTTGLHMSDINNFYRIVKNLVDKDNTVIIIEHNLDIIKYADWIIDLGPGGGKNGGHVMFEGIPEDLVKDKKSITGKYLKEYL